MKILSWIKFLSSTLNTLIKSILKRVKEYLETELSLNTQAINLYEDASIAIARKARWLGDQPEQLSRELLENPEEDNQQPSPGSNSSEGSTTSSYGPSGTMKNHERGTPKYLYYDNLLISSDLLKDIMDWSKEKGDDIV